jgi:16S rRNA processing protein RimM
MIKEYLEIGQVGATHGVRGEFRLNPWCDGPEFVKKFKTLYRDDKGNNPLKVISCRPHGNVSILKIEGIDTIEDAKAMKNTVLYMKRSDVNLPKGKWFISELIGCDVLDADDNNIKYGVITNAETGVANDYWYVDTPDGEVLIPAIKDVVINCDVENNKVYIKPLRGLFDNED